MKKITGIIFSLCFVLIGQAQTPDVWDGTSDTTWYNTTDTLFQLTTAEQLAGLAVMVNHGNSFQGKTIELMNDVDLGGALDTPLNWMPIGCCIRTDTGTIYTNFSGIFNGNNKSIMNVYLYSNIVYTFEFGLFGSIDSACLHNILIKNVVFDIFNSNYIRCGSLIGNMSNSSIYHCNVESNLYFDFSFMCIGGIVGEATQSVISNSCFYGKIEGDTMQYVGGILGYSLTTMISNCYVIADISGNSVIGGLIGCSVWSTVHNNFFIGKAKGINTYLGGLIASSQEDTVENNFVITSVNRCEKESQSPTFAGGIIGFGSDDRLINNYIVGGIVEDIYSCGGIVGGASCELINCYAATYISENGSMNGNIAGLLNNSTINTTFMDNNIGAFDGVGYNYMGNGEVIGFFTEEMTSGNSFGLQDSVGIYPAKWIYEEGLYPQLDVFVNHPDTIFRQASLLSVIPIFLGEQAANQIRNDFKVSTLYGVSWTSSAEDIIRIEGENAIVTPIDKDTMIVLTVTLNDLQKEFYVKVKQGNDIKEVNINKLNLYPNPSNYQFTLDNGQELMKEVYLYDVMGRKVQHLPVNAPSTTIDVSDLPNGIYVVKISTANGVLVRKVQVVK
ncbi:MAG: T9SS type A sorting domain-containing protein [Bacteroidales bacterium]|nr:T9SS type A sorting domain-containing protein [Bacteroidales bacterium]